MRDLVAGWIAGRAGIAIAAIEDDAPFAAYGLTSVDAAALAEEMSRSTGRMVPVTAVFEYPTVAAFARYLTSGPSAQPAHAAKAPTPKTLQTEPLAIVGIACRLPGAADPAAFWQMLLSGTGAVQEIPPQRWDADTYYSPEPGVPGRMISKWAGLLEDIDMFDPGAFGITVAEAERMDPQQRLLLEVSAEALADAGWTKKQLAGSATGVFAGISTSEYARRLVAVPETIDATMATGNALSVAANRISYTFDLRGPSIAVDTACSSSLVATHMAVRALRSGECDRAVVAGVNLLLDPELSITLSRAGMLAPDGKCKVFDARADGYVRGEGCVAVTLTPLSAARERDERIYALIRGSAVNSDGRTNGLTAPNPAAQQAVLRSAYADAGVDPAAVGYVECHGTGTALGDPLEVSALASVAGGARRAPCLIGSVKSNIGHLESAAGLAGLLKAVLAVHHGEVPATIHLQDLNPALPLRDTGLVPATQRQQWPVARARYAGVSGFGFGGTNAHVVLEGPPAEPSTTAAAAPDIVVLPLSARSPAALAALATQWVSKLETAPACDLSAMAYTAAVRRDHDSYRLAVSGRRPGELAASLRRWLDEGVRGLRARPRPPQIGFLFSGQGAQYAGMGDGLLADSLFASTLRRCEEAAVSPGGPAAGDPQLPGAGDLALTEHAQPALFAMQVGLAAVLRSYGVRPAAVAGHSVGEVAAVHVAGLLGLPDGMRVAVMRGRAMAGARGAGRMLVTSLTEEEADAVATGPVHVAAVNGPRRTVLSGTVQALELVQEELRRAGRPGTWVPGDYPFHSPLLKADVRAAVETAAPRLAEGRVPWYSTVTGAIATGIVPDAGYWERNATQRVRLADAVAAMIAAGVEVFVEVGPHPTLLSSVRDVAKDLGRDDIGALAVARRNAGDAGDAGELIRALCGLYERGCDVRWERLWPTPPRVVSVPIQPWQRHRCWIERAAPRSPAQAAAGLLGERIDLAASKTARWQGEFGVEPGHFLSGHRVAGAVVFPGAGYVELALAAARQHGYGAGITIRDLEIRQALRLGTDRRRVQVTLTDDGTVTVHSRPAGTPGDWTGHATATVATAEGPEDAIGPVLQMPVNLDDLPSSVFYRTMTAAGLDYGPVFRRLRDIRRADGAATARVVKVPSAAPGRESAAAAEVLDACIQLAAAALPGADARATSAWLFAGVREIRFPPPGLPAAAGPWQAVAGRVAEREGVAEADAQLLDATGTVVLAELRGIQLRQAGRIAGNRAGTEPVWLYEPVWRAAGLPPAAGTARAADQRWVLLAGQSETAGRLAARIAASGARCVVARRGPSYEWRGDGDVTLDPDSAEHHQRLLSDLPGTSQGVRYALLDLRGIGAGPRDTAPVTGVLNLLRALSATPVTVFTVVAVVTAGTQAVHDPGEVVAPGAAGAWGLIKALPFENPTVRWQCIDLSPDPGEDELETLLAELTAASRLPAEAEVALRGRGRFVRRLVPLTVAPAGRTPVERSGGYVITGGLGDLGLLMARHLIGNGACGIALIGRSAPSPGALRAVEAMRESAAVLVLQADVTVRDQLAGALATVRREFGGIRGVIHAAGVLKDQAMLTMEPEDVRSVFAPKAQGAWLVHECCQEDHLDWFVCFSSAACVLGSPGQASYCAANAALDSFAMYRRGLGLRTITIDWGPWAEAGMAARAGHDERALRTAVGTIGPDLGCEITDRLLASDHPQAVALGYDLRHLVQYHPGGPGLSMFGELVGEEGALLPSMGGGPATAPRPPLPQQYVEPRNELEQRIAGLWCSALGLDAVGVHDAFFELGGDSVMGNQVLVQTNQMFGITLDAAKAFGDFTVAGLAELVELEMIKHLDELTEDQARDAAAQS